MLCRDMLENKNIGFVGAGIMAGTIAEGMLAAGAVTPAQIMMADPRQDRLDELATEFGVSTTRDNREAAEFADVLMLATKPQVFARVLPEIAGSLEDTLVVSIAAGVPVAAIEARLPTGTRVVRTMPNTPSLVGAGATAIAKGSHASDDDLEIVKRLFDALGIIEVLSEAQLDAVTGLSGSGPAFIFVIIEALSDAGVKMGLHRRTAQKLAAQTVYGSAKLLIETGDHPGQLKDMVASPGGTTIAGLHTLESGGLRTTLINAVETATRRSEELGAEYSID